MKKALIATLSILIVVFVIGCSVTKEENEAQLKKRVDEYHGLLLNMSDSQKAANNEYAVAVLAYLSPTDKNDAALKASYLQGEWLKRNMRAQGAHQSNYINVETITMGPNGKSAIVNVVVSRTDGPVKRAEKWVRIDDKWYRTAEFSY